MDSAAAELAKALIEAEWATESDIVGCSNAEISELETTFGVRLAESYKDFLRTLGKGAGQFESESAWQFSSLERARQIANRMIDPDRDDMLGKNVFKLPSTAFVFLENNASQFLFIDTASGDNPAVYLYERPNEQPQKWRESFTNWVNVCTNEIIESIRESHESKARLAEAGIKPVKIKSTTDVVNPN